MVLYFNYLSIPQQGNRAFISVIPKADNDPTDISNYRPISLINCNLKIPIKELVLQFRYFLELYIHKYQLDFICYRQVSY